MRTLKTEGIHMSSEWDFPDTDVMDEDALKSLEAQSSEWLDEYVEAFDITVIAKPWVEGFVSKVGVYMMAKAKHQLASKHLTKNEILVSYPLDWDIYTQTLRHFELVDMVKTYLVEHWKDGYVDIDVGMSSRAGRTLLCAFRVNS